MVVTFRGMPLHTGNMMQDAVTSLTKYRADVISGAYPLRKHSIYRSLKEPEYEKFMELIGGYKVLSSPSGLVSNPKARN